MNRRRLLLLAGILVGGAAAGLVWWLAARPTLVISFPDNADFPLPVAGHIGMVLKHTNILELNGLRAEVTAQQSIPGIDDLLAQKVDVILLGQAAPLLRIDEGLDGKVVACLGAGGSMGLLVPPTSKVEKVADLKGAKVAALLGNAAHRWLVSTLEAAGLTENDVELLPYSQVNLFDQRLGALVSWSPRYQVMLRRFRYRSLAETIYYQAVFFSQKFIDERPEEAVNVLVAIKQALWFWSTHNELVHSWWSHGHERPPARLIARILTRFNLNYRAETWDDIDMSLADEYVQDLRDDAAFLLARGYLERPVDVPAHIDRDLLEKAEKKAVELDQALIEADEPEPAASEKKWADDVNPILNQGPSFQDGEGLQENSSIKGGPGLPDDGDPNIPDNGGPNIPDNEGSILPYDGGPQDDPVINRGPNYRGKFVPQDERTKNRSPNFPDDEATPDGPEESP